MVDMKTTRRGFLGAAAAASISGCLGGSGSEPITVGIVPDVDPDTAIEQNTALRDYLESELGVGVKLDTSADYAGMVRAMVAEQVDIAYYGGVSYILAHHRAGAEPLVVGSKNGKKLWNSAFIVPESSDIQSMADVQERAGDLKLVFGDPISTSGTVMPTYYLRTEYDLKPEEGFDQLTHVGAHDATARTISNASNALGALNSRIYDALVEEGKVEGVREIWRSPGFPDYPWAVAPTLENKDPTAEDVRKAFTSLTPEDNGEIMEQQNVDKYVKVTHEDFTSLDTAVEMAGIEKKKKE